MALSSRRASTLASSPKLPGAIAARLKALQSLMGKHPVINGPCLLRTLELGLGTHVTCTDHQCPTNELVVNWITERVPRKRQTSYVSPTGPRPDPLMLIEENLLDLSSHCTVQSEGPRHIPPHIPPTLTSPHKRRHDLGWTQWFAGLFEDP